MRSGYFSVYKMVAWHPAFVAACHKELTPERNLFMIPERNLSKEPLRIDLYVQNADGEKIQNQLGELLRKYNIFEFKNPVDSLSIDDLFKTVGYGCLLKGLGDSINQFPEQEITISIFRDTIPRKLFSDLKKSGRDIVEAFPGIFYLKGNLIFPIQIVVTSRLGKEHVFFRVLSKRADLEDIERFLGLWKNLESPGERNNFNAILEVSVKISSKLYQKLKEESEMCCDALRELMKEEIREELDEAMEKGEAKGIQIGEAKGIQIGEAKGIKKGEEKSNLEAIHCLMTKLGYTAEKAMQFLNILPSDQEKYLQKL